jgi:hypothetical protein
MLAAAAALATTAVLLAGCAAPVARPGAIACPAPRTTDATAPAWPWGALGLPGPDGVTGAGVLVAVVDSGIAPGALPAAAVAAGSASLVPGETLDDADGHGTAMAQLVHGVAPGAGILALKAVDDAGGARTAWVADAVRRAVADGADVVSLSLETPADDPALADALRAASDAGVVLVAAAGNRQLDLDRFPRYPASYDLPGMLVVAAADAVGALAPGTNRGAETVDVAAPGTGIPVTDADGAVRTVEGSSPAAALAAGAAALVLSAGAPSDAVAGILTGSASPRAALDGVVRSGGVIDVRAALACRAVG